MRNEPTWDPRLAPILYRLSTLKPEDLPPAPWVLDSTNGRVSSSYLGGPYMRVTNNEGWLAAILGDVRAGPDGARGKAGAIQHDLFLLERALVYKAAREGRLYACRCSHLWEELGDSSPEACPSCGKELRAESAGYRAEKAVGVDGVHSKGVEGRMRRIGL